MHLDRIANDTPARAGYSKCMEEQSPYLTIRLDLKDPVELSDFVDFFAGIGRQFEKYIKAEHAIGNTEPTVFVKEVRKGSIVAEIFAVGGTLIEHMDKTLIVLGFASLFSKRVRGYIQGVWEPSANKTDLKDFLSTVKSVQKDNNGKASLETAIYRKGLLQTDVALTFNTTEASAAVKAIESHRMELDRTSAADYERVLMHFQRSDKGSAEIGKRSGEKVVIEAVSPKDLALIYASPLSESRIKDEIRNSDENIYKKGFVVDANAQTRGGKIVAYAVTNVHQVIDLPDD